MSDAGKYRWMTGDEAFDRIHDGEHVWVFNGNMRGCYLMAELVFEHRVNGKQFGPDARICRAMVPLPPE